MTKEEILEMKPGREQDVLVAKEIFGIEVEWDYRTGDVNHVLPKLPYLKGEPRIVLGPMAHSVSNTIYEYSTHISAAWLVVEKVCNWDIGDNMLILKGQGPNLEPTEENERVGWWEAEINGDWGKVIAEGKIAPEAICKAALLAKLECV